MRKDYIFEFKFGGHFIGLWRNDVNNMFVVTRILCAAVNGGERIETTTAICLDKDLAVKAFHDECGRYLNEWRFS